MADAVGVANPRSVHARIFYLCSAFDAMRAKENEQIDQLPPELQAIHFSGRRPVTGQDFAISLRNLWETNEHRTA